jgi:hypothetical protein
MNDTRMFGTESHECVLFCERSCQLVVTFQMALVEHLDSILPSGVSVSGQHDLRAPRDTPTPQMQPKFGLTVE